MGQHQMGQHVGEWVSTPKKKRKAEKTGKIKLLKISRFDNTKSQASLNRTKKRHLEIIYPKYKNKKG